MFTLTFSPLLERLRRAGFDALAYADDLAICNNKKDTLLKAIKIVEEWAIESKMTINHKKSGILYLRKNKRSDKQKAKFEEKKEYVEGYPINLQYKYLGVVFDETLRFEEHLAHI